MKKYLRLGFILVFSLLSFSLNAQTYCTSAAVNATDEEILNVTVGTLNNTSTCFTTGGAGSILNRYSDYTTTVAAPNIIKGASVSFSINIGTCGGIYPSGTAIFIDFNKNGNFTDAGEQVYGTTATTSGPHTVSGSFVVPATAVVGNTRMRVINAESYAGTSITPCQAYSYGETEDYTVAVIAGTPCTGTPNPGNTLSSVSMACSGVDFTLSLQNNFTTSGITYQWQSSTNNTSWTNISGATNYSFTTWQVVSTYYRCAVTCSNTSSTGNSNSTYVGMNGVTSCYCVPPASSNPCTAMWITNVSTSGGVSDFNKTSTCSASSYSDFSTSYIASNTQLGNTTMSFTSTGYAMVFSVWIDFNDNGVFESSERVIANGNPGLTLTVSDNFTVPVNAAPGTHKMRVRSEYYLDGVPSDPCSNLKYGETEDYAFTVIAPTYCSPTPSSYACTYMWISNVTTSGGISDFNNSTVCAGSSTDFSGTKIASNMQLANTTMSFTSTGYAMAFSVWIDFNHNGVFEASEKVITNQNSSQLLTVTDNFTVPITATPGTHKMRVRGEYYNNGAPSEPCNILQYGETEDYAFTVIATPPCTGTPNPGNTLSAVSSVCSGVNFSLSLQNNVTAIGITYQWQSSPDNNTWTNISGTSASLITSQTVSTYYRCAVTCSNTSSTGNSNSTYVAVNGVTSCYCTPPVSYYPCNYWISSVTTSGGVSDFNNPSDCGGSSYSDFSGAVIASNSQLATTSMSFTSTGNAMAFSVWIDYNDNGVFEASEWVIDNKNPGGAYTVDASFTVPISATPGTHRMRVRGEIYGSEVPITDPCNKLYYGETEDYAFTVIAAPPCTGTPNPGNTISSVSSACSGVDFTLSLQNSCLEAGISYQWQFSPDNNAWTNISGATNATLITSQTVPTYYRCEVTCSAGPTAAFSNSTHIAINSITSCYCIPPVSFYNYCSLWISGVSTSGGISNFDNNSGCAGNSYEDFNASKNVSNLHLASTSLSLSSTGYPMAYAVWIDFNDNGVFENTEQVIANANSLNEMTVNANFIVPASAAPGTHRMRVRGDYQSNGIPVDPCSQLTEGETEDYSFTVVIIPVSQIDVSSVGGATTIESEAGTLQMSALVLPVDASNKAVTWTVTDGTGRASISADGLLTALINGTVTVTATSTDGTYISGSKQITISNQIVTPDDKNIIKDGGFATDGAVGGYWSAWSGNGGNSQIIGGVCTMTPGAVSDIWQLNVIQEGWMVSNGSSYLFTFTAWAAADRTFNISLEDPNNNYNRIGSSNDPESTYGRTEWAIPVTTTPTTFAFHTTIDSVKLNTLFRFAICASNAMDIVYIDNISLVNEIFEPSGISVKEPSNGGNWKSGTQQNIDWTTVNVNQNVNLQYSIDGGNTWSAIATNIIPVKGYNIYTWTVANVNGIQDNSMIRVITADGTVSGTSNLFTISMPFVMNTVPVTTCNGFFYDSGGENGDYSINEDFTKVFSPATAGNKMSFSFSSFYTEPGWDYLYVYDGPGTSSPEFSGSPFTGNVSIGTITASAQNTSGAITFRFTSDYLINGTGWAAGISCVPGPILPTVTTNPVTLITTTTASSGGNITDDGGAEITARGVCWSTNVNPTIQNSFTTNSSGVGAFISNLAGLTPNTSYHLRAYATNITGTAYGDDVSFTTSAIDPSTMVYSLIGNAFYKNDGITLAFWDYDIDLTYLSTTGNVSSYRLNDQELIQNGEFKIRKDHQWNESYGFDEVTILGDAANFVKQDVNIKALDRKIYEITFKVDWVNNTYAISLVPVSPTITTTVISSVTSGSAVSGGEVVAEGTKPVSSRGVCWSTSQNPTISDSYTTDGSGAGSFTSSITGLSPITTYYARAYATSGFGTFYGSVDSFYTLNSNASITSLVFSIDEGTLTITNIPYNETLNSFKNNLTPADGSTFKVYQSDGSTVASDLQTGYKLKVTAQDVTITKTYTITKNTAPSSDANFLAYKAAGVEATVNSASHTVTATLPYGTNVTNLAPVFVISGGATAKIGTTTQVSGVNTNNFTNPVVYLITAEDGTTVVSWTVTINITPASTNATLSSVAYTVDNSAGTIFNVPGTETLAVFKGKLTPATGATFEVYQSNGTTVASDLQTGYKVIVTAQNGTTTKTYTIVSSKANFITFSIAGVNGTLNSTTHTVTATLPYGTNVTNLAATFSISSGASAKVGSTVQVSGVSTNSFTNPVVYNITAEDATTVVSWTVTITLTAASTDATVSSTSYTIDNYVGTIINIPSSETLAAFKGKLTPATGATFEVYQNDGTSVATNLNTGYKLIVTAQNGTTKKTYTITLNTAVSNEANLITFSTSGVGAAINSSTHAVTATLPYGTNVTNLAATFSISSGASVKVGSTVQVSGINTNNFTNPVVYAITAEDGTTVVSWTVTITVTPASTDATVSSTAFTVNNSAGTIINIPITETLTSFKANLTPATGATFEVYQSDETTVASDLQTGYKVFVIAQDGATTKTYTITLNAVASSEANFIAFSTSGVDATINSTSRTVIATLPYGTNVTNLAATFSISGGASAKVGSTVQVSSVNTNNFTNPVVYSITAEDGTVTSWTVTITVAAASTDATVSSTTYTVNNSAGTIINIPNTETLAVFKSKLTPATGATFQVYQSDETTVASDLQTGYKVFVIAQDGASTKTYTITLNTAGSNLANILTFKVTGINGTINTTNHTVSVTLPYGTNINNLVAFYVISPGASAKVGTTAQVSGTSTNDFTNPVVYILTAENGTTVVNWTVTITVSPASTDATLSSVAYTVNNSAGTIFNLTGTETLAVFKNNLTPATGATFEVYLSNGTTVASDLQIGYKVIVTAQNVTTTKTYTIVSSKANFITFSAAGVNATINSTTHTVTATLPYGTNVTNLVASFSISGGASAIIGSTAQVSGVNTNNFTNPVVYNITAEDATTVVSWTVTITVTSASTDATLSSVAYTVNNTAGTIFKLPDAETLAVFKNNLTPATGATFEVYHSNGTTVASDLQIGYKVIVTAQNGTTTKTYTIVSSKANFITFSTASVNATINSTTHTVTATLPYGTNVTNLAATFSISGGASAKVGSTVQVSGVTTNSFTNPVVYNITAEDGNTILSWTVTITLAAASSDATVSSTAFTVNNSAETIINVPITETLATFKSNLTPATGATFEVYQSNGTTVASDLQTGYKLIVTAQNSTTKKTYTITLNTAVSNEANLITFSTSGVGATINSTTHAVTATLPYGTNVTNLAATFSISSGASAKVGTTAQVSGVNTNNFTNPVVYAITAEDGTTVVSWTVTITVTPASTDATVSSTAFTVNNSAGTIINVPITETLTSFKANLTPATGATFEVYQSDGTTVASDLQTGYKLIVTAQNGTTKKTYTITLNTALSNEANLITFITSGVNAAINSTSHAVTATLPYGTNVTNLAATFSISSGASAKVGSTVQVSSVNTNNFTNPVVYSITAEDGTVTSWTVTITVAAANTDATVSSTIYTVNNLAKTISNIPLTEILAVFKSNLTPATAATFKVYHNDGITVASDLQTGYKVIVTAQDGIATKTYTITLNSAVSSDANFITFHTAGVDATVNSAGYTVTATLPYGSNITSLVATFNISAGASAKVGTTAQVSGVNTNNFTNPVVYVITAEDGTVISWTVTITVTAASTDATLSSVAYTVDNSAGTIMQVPYTETLAAFKGNLTPASGATFEVYHSDGTTVASDLQTGYKVKVTAQNGTTTKTYIIDISLAGTAASNTTICSGSIASLTLTGYSGTIQWQQSANGSTSWVNVSGGTGANSASYTTANLTATTYYRAVVTNPPSAAVNSNVVTVTVTQTPGDAGVISGSAAVCLGSSVTYTVPAIDNATSYIWTLPNGTTGTSTADTISVNFGVSFVSGGIQVKGQNSCSIGNASILPVSVNPSPASAGIISGLTEVCQGVSSVTYTVPDIANATSYIWTQPIGATGTSTTSSIAVNYGTSAVSGNITVKGFNSCGNGTASTLAIIVNPLPSNAASITGLGTVCQNQSSVDYAVPDIANASSYIWTLPGGATGSGTSTNIISVDYGPSAVSGNITWKGHNACGDGAIGTKEITVFPLPDVAGTISGDTIVCKSSAQIKFSVPAIPSATSYVWTIPATGATGTSVGDSIMVVFGQSFVSGNITVKGRNSCGSGTSATLAIQVSKVPGDAGQISGPAAVCLGNSATFTVPAIDNATSYLWTLPTGATGTDTTNSITIDFGSSFVNEAIEVYGKNTCFTGTPSSFIMSANQVPATAGTISSPSSDAFSVCLNQQAVVYNVATINFATSYIWTLPTGATVSGASNLKVITVNYGPSAVSGNISVKGYSACDGPASSKPITVRTPYQGEQICLVTIDTETGKNLVVWEKTADVDIASYNIYRETNVGDVYSKIDNVSADSLSVYLDMGSDPESFAHKYYISAVDNCGNESGPSDWHKTMLLQSSLSTDGKSVVLDWTEYKTGIKGELGSSFLFTSYIIYRSTNANNLDSITTLPSDNTKYTDKTAPVGVNLYYRIAGVKADPCDPAGLLGKKASSGPFVHSLSNLEDNRLQSTGISNPLADALQLSVYPSPFTDLTFIDYKLEKPTKMKVEIYNVIGEKLKILLDENQSAGYHKVEMKAADVNYKPGVYYLRITVDDAVLIRKTMLTR